MFGSSSVFYEVNENENILLAEKQVINIVNEHYRNLIEGLKSQNILLNTTNAFTPFVLPVKDVYLSGVNSDYERRNNKTSLFILSAIGFLILIIACSNFILLSLGQSFKKVREVGIRKTMGAGKGNIFNLFFTENIILTLLALIFGLILCFLLIPVFDQLAQNGIYTDLINPLFISVFVVICILFILISTSFFPLIKLAKIRPNMLMSKKSGKGKRIDITSIFVTIQYGLSIILIILTISIVRQTNYMKYKDLGFSSKNIISLRIYPLDNSDKNALRDRLMSNPEILNLTLTDRDFVSGRGNNYVKTGEGEYISTRILNVDNNYIPTLGLKIIDGENFSDVSLVNQTVIINEKLLASLNLDDKGVGQSINMDGKNYRITGVVKDFHFDSMKEEIESLMLILRTEKGDRGSFMFIKYNPSQLDKVIPFIQNTWKEIAPDKELNLNFWDKQLNQRYENEEKWSHIIGYAAIIAIIISSLGLFGLTLLVINRRVKEIGIRKVNGAKVSEVLTMLDKDFIKWVVIAFIIACPIAWYTMHKWLENFAYKTNLSWWIFGLAGILALGIALLTVSWQSWRAATKNPVEALRYE